MGDVKHTPGPWTADDEDELDGIPFVPVYAGESGTESWKDIAHVMPSDRKNATEFFVAETDRANARLIAAAPDGYESVRELLTFVRIKYGNLDPDANAACGRAEAYLAKAEGTTT